MVEEIGVGAVFFIESVGEGEEFVVGFDDGFFYALEADFAVAEVFFDAERDEGSVKHLLIEAVVAQGFDELDEMGDLARVDDAEAIDVPAHGVTGLIDPPIMIVAETHVTPAESRSCFSHESGNFSQRASGVSKNKHKTEGVLRGRAEIVFCAKYGGRRGSARVLAFCGRVCSVA